LGVGRRRDPDGGALRGQFDGRDGGDPVRGADEVAELEAVAEVAGHLVGQREGVGRVGPHLAPRLPAVGAGQDGDAGGGQGGAVVFRQDADGQFQLAAARGGRSSRAGEPWPPSGEVASSTVLVRRSPRSGYFSSTAAARAAGSKRRKSGSRRSNRATPTPRLSQAPNSARRATAGSPRA